MVHRSAYFVKFLRTLEYRNPLSSIIVYIFSNPFNNIWKFYKHQE